ncbi:hypothetical protein ACRALDRAFT_1078015 [Sodiomyces alcalophilus JCM 7366]|uniref:uncharacterized protein n=1 Tax=Sodiomyces alcalophilus JCM 7366 TaxID=591952 RepID=UPI0039B4E7AA
MYERLRSFQGRLIPICYGEARCEGTRALILSEVVGIELFRQPSPYLSPAEFQRRFEEAFAELSPLNLAHSDLKLDNYLLVGDGLVILDLESVTEEDPKNVEFINQSHAQHLRMRYEGHLDGLARYGRARVPGPPTMPPAGWDTAHKRLSEMEQKMQGTRTKVAQF